MQKTLFLYIFRDLFKVFLLASGALAGIMSFGGLLRPLTQHNLAIGQVAQMLGYFMPAMTNYSWPIAVLFATTFVYGRLSADNELTACRASGIPYWQMMMPAGVLGIAITLLSMAFLCYVVPHSFLKAERVVYSNLARLVAGQIERTQRVNLNSAAQGVTIFARSAQALEPNATRPTDQAVELNDIAIVNYVNDKDRDRPKVPGSFYTADKALALFQMPVDADGDVLVTLQLTNGDKVPRVGSSGADGGRVETSASFGATSAGPFPLPSPVRETSKFMDIRRLLELRAHPEKSRRIGKSLNDLAAVAQRTAYVAKLDSDLRAGRPIVLAGTDNGRAASYTIEPPARAASSRPAASVRDDQLVIVAGTVERPGIDFRYEGASAAFSGKARQITLAPTPNADAKLVYVRVEVRDATLMYRDEESPLQSREWSVAVPMPEDVARLSERTAVDYFAEAGTGTGGAGGARLDKLRSDFTKHRNSIEAELHSRFGFAFSCLILAFVGAAIGMMFKSGNFVSAFAISVGPALVSIVLIVTGQHIAESVPNVIGKNFQDPLNAGLGVLWLGNGLVVAFGLALYRRLCRT